MNLLLGLLFLLGTTALGFCVLRLGNLLPDLGWAGIAAFSYLVGGGMTASLASFWLMAGGRLTTASTAIGAIAGTASLVALLLLWKDRPRSWTRLARPGWTWLPALLLATDLVILGAGVMRLGLGWDGLVVWAIKAKLLYADDGSLAAVLTDSSRYWTNQAYPLLIPTTEAELYGLVGAVDEHLAKLVFLGFLLALVGLLGSFVARIKGTLAGIGFALFLLAQPDLVTYAVTGYADLPLSAFILAGAGLVYLWIEGGDPKRLAMAGLVTALGLAVKREAAVTWALDAAAIAAWSTWSRRGFAASARGCLLFAAPAVLILPWLMFVRHLGLTDVDFVAPTPANLLAGIDRLPNLVDDLGIELVNGGHWVATWVLLAASLGLAAVRRSLHPGQIYLLGLIALDLVIVTSSFMLSTWVPYQTHVDVALDRLVLQMVPVAVLLLATLMPFGGPESSSRGRRESLALAKP